MMANRVSSSPNWYRAKRTLLSLFVCAPLCWPLYGFSIFDYIATEPDLATLTLTSNSAGYFETLSKREPITLFAPRNQAFLADDVPDLEALLTAPDRNTLAALIGAHILPETLFADLVTDVPLQLLSINGIRMELQNKAGVFTVNGRPIVAADIETDNGLIHLVEDLIVSGEELTQAARVHSGLPASNRDGSETSETSQEDAAADGQDALKNALKPSDIKSDAASNLLVLLERSGQFTQFVALLKQVRMDVGVASYPGYTVFAPSDDALNKLTEQERRALTAITQNRTNLIRFLAAHIVDGNPNLDAQARQRHQTINPSRRLIIQRDEDTIRVNQSRVIKRNVKASNGTLHVIDRPLLP